MRDVRIGCSGWNYVHWRERIYPKGLPPRRWLDHYATLFDTVEINTPSTAFRTARRFGLGRREPTSVPVRGQGEPLPHPRQAPDRPRVGGRALLRAPRAPRRVPEARPCALAAARQLPARRRAPGGRARRRCRPDGTASSSATRAGLRPTSTSSCARTESRSSSATIPSGPSRRTSSRPDWTFVRFHYGQPRPKRQLLGSRARGAGHSGCESWRRRVEVYAYFNNDWEGYAVRNGVLLRKLLGLEAPASRTNAA